MFRIYKKFILAILILIAVLLSGTIGFWFVSHKEYSLTDCFYMTFITVTTIGYGEIIEVGKYPYGRYYTIIVAALGIGIFTFLITNITAFIVSGELLKSFKKRKFTKMIKKLSDHYIICGSGDTGIQIAHELFNTKRPFVLIDKSDFENHEIDKDYLFYHGDATDENTLELAGIKNAAGVFAVTGDDNYNLVITFTVKQLNPNVRVIAKSRDIKNSDKIKKAGADSVISSNFIGSLRMVSEMIRPNVVTFLDTMLRDKDKSLRVEEISIGKSFEGKTIASLNLKKHKNALLLAIKKNEQWIFNPMEDEILSEGTNLILMLTPEERLHLVNELS